MGYLARAPLSRCLRIEAGLAWAVLAWIVFNAFVGLYEALLFASRSLLEETSCPAILRGFWARGRGRLFEKTFWIDTWREYACAADTRYLKPGSHVHVIESLNAVLAFALCMWALLLLPRCRSPMKAVTSPKLELSVLLLAQALNCVVYFATLAISGGIPPDISWRGRLYLGVSAVWVAVPAMLLLFLSLR